MIELYSCNIKNNDKCKKNNCICNGGPCKYTTNFIYAKKTPLNYFKMLFNKIVKK